MSDLDAFFHLSFEKGGAKELEKGIIITHYTTVGAIKTFIQVLLVLFSKEKDIIEKQTN